MRTASGTPAILLPSLLFVIFSRPLPGQKPGQVFESKNGQFSVIVPTFPWPGITHVQKDGGKESGAVSFYGEFGEQRGIVYEHVPESAPLPADSALQFSVYERALDAFIAAHPGRLLLSRPYRIDSATTLLGIVF